MESRKQSPIDEFIIHGIKSNGGYDYYLLIDASGRCYIEQVKDDDSTMLFAKMTEPTSADTFAERAVLITNFWAAYTGHTYQYLFQC